MATPQETGYDCEFVDNVKDYECPLCLHVTREPHLTTCCGQHFCQQCIQTAKSSNKACPFCKDDDFMAFLDKKQKRRVLDIKVYCEYKHEECDWIGGLGELEQHLAEKCNYVSVKCPNNCGQAIFRFHVNFHQILECPKRPHTCKYCQLRGLYQDIEENHVPVCPKYPVSCPNECEASCLQRDQVEEHLRRECPLAMVECELREVGCEERVQRKDLDRHMEQAARKHLTLSTNYFIKNLTKQEKDLRRQYKEMTKIRQENDKLRQDCIRLQRECSLLQHQSIEHEKKLSALANQAKVLSNRISLNVTYFIFFMSFPNSRWKNTERYKTFSGYTITVDLYRMWLPEIAIELTHVKSPMDDYLEWPKTFSMKVRIINQTGDHHHHEVSRDNLRVARGGMNDRVRIDCNIIEHPPDGVQYIVDGFIKMELVVAESIMTVIL